MPEAYRIVCDSCAKEITATSLMLTCSRCGTVIGLEKPAPTEQAKRVMESALAMKALIEANRGKAAEC